VQYDAYSGQDWSHVTSSMTGVDASVTRLTARSENVGCK